ncbi:MAG: DUF4189 domain-containing protein [Rhodospirillaceae bacterium]|nr:DUF4189 domain-containing protein [Rhodospirillaceae bacterium]
MKRIRIALLALSALVAMAAAPGAAQASCSIGNCWGAVAYGPGGAWAWRVNYPSRASASHAVQRACRGRCTRVLSFRNSCGAYATGYGGHYGWGNAGSGPAARMIALRECRMRGPGCSIRVWGCTSR